MNFMEEENKESSTENKGKVIEIKKSKLVIAVIAIIIVIGLVVWFFYFKNPTDDKIEYIANDTPVLGEEDATINVIEFSDYECPFCQASEGTNQEVIESLKQSYPGWEAPIPKVIEDYVSTGKVRLAFRQYPLHANSKDASLAAKCAQEQNSFWDYHKKLFENYNAIAITDLKKYAIDLKLNMSQFTECLESKKYESDIENDLSDGSGLGVSGTPTFFVGNEATGYEKIVGAQPFSAFKQIIDSKISV